MELNHVYSGAAQYVPDYQDGPHRLIVSVFCWLGDLRLFTHALLDTGSEWCAVPPSLAERPAYDLTSDPAIPPLQTRFCLLLGREERIPLTFPAFVGANLTLPATCFISADWPGSMVIGWKGCLERIRIALHPSEEAFYFGTLPGEEEPF